MQVTRRRETTKPYLDEDKTLINPKFMLGETIYNSNPRVTGPREGIIQRFWIGGTDGTGKSNYGKLYFNVQVRESGQKYTNWWVTVNTLKYLKISDPYMNKILHSYSFPKRPRIVELNSEKDKN